MRKLFTLCLLVFSLSVSAQWQQTGSKVRYVNGLGIPTRDTAAGVLADSSQILIRPADSSLYVKYKRTWLRVGGAGFTGSGTTNYIPKFTSSTAIGNSQIFDNGTNVGIGTTSLFAKLQVNSSGAGFTDAFIIENTNTPAANLGTALTFAGTGTASQSVIRSGWNGAASTDAYMTFLTRGSNSVTERMRITSGGNALIGTTTDNGTDRLQVSGNVEIRGQSGNVTTPTYLKLDQSYSLTPAFNKLKIYFYVDATESYGYGVGSNSDLQYWAGSTTTGMHRFYTKQTEAVRITPNQSILINTTTDNNTDKLQVNGSIQGTGFNQAYTAKTGTYTATTSDYFIDCTSGTFTVNLFTAVGNTGRILIIKNSGTGTITVDPNGSETIDGATTQTLSTQWSRVHIISDGANWKIISN